MEGIRGPSSTEKMQTPTSLQTAWHGTCGASEYLCKLRGRNWLPLQPQTRMEAERNQKRCAPLKGPQEADT